MKTETTVEARIPGVINDDLINMLECAAGYLESEKLFSVEAAVEKTLKDIENFAGRTKEGREAIELLRAKKTEVEFTFKSVEVPEYDSYGDEV